MKTKRGLLIIDGYHELRALLLGYLVGDRPGVVRALLDSGAYVNHVDPHEGEADLHVVFKFLGFDMALTVAIQKSQGYHDMTVC